MLDVLRAMRSDAAHESVFARVDDAVRLAQTARLRSSNRPRPRSRRRSTELARRVDDTLGLERDASETRSAALAARLIELTSAALLLEQAVDDPRKGLIALRYARRHLIPDSEWTDQIASRAGRELLAYAEIDEADAIKAAS